MTDFVDSTVRDIDARLRELQGEVERLQAARAALMGSSSATATTRRRPGRPRGSGSGSSSGSGSRRAGRRPGRPRGRRGGNTRANQALELVRSQPGVTIPDIATALGIEPNYLYRVMPRLVADGKVIRDGQGWHATSAD
ncbi:MAG: hypothetical protein ACYC91_10060 [Solirubrobacteraceae bacterium]